jgi:hypothetical protein
MVKLWVYGDFDWLMQPSAISLRFFAVKNKVKQQTNAGNLG